MTVKLWGVDRLHLRFDYHSESYSYQLVVYFLFMKHTHIQVFKKECKVHLKKVYLQYKTTKLVLRLYFKVY